MFLVSMDSKSHLLYEYVIIFTLQVNVRPEYYVVCWNLQIFHIFLSFWTLFYFILLSNIHMGTIEMRF